MMNISVLIHYNFIIFTIGELVHELYGNVLRGGGKKWSWWRRGKIEKKPDPLTLYFLSAKF